MMLLVVSIEIIALVLVSSQDNNEESKTHTIDSKSFAQSLRRQLMHDNYDYSHEETNLTENNNINENGNKNKTRRNFYVSDLTVDETIRENVNHTRDNVNVKNENDVKVAMSNKDEVLTTGDTEKFAETAKYKLLKVRRQFRRGGQARLIQEEGKDGVSIVNIDGGPFPELRLPRSRRQYMLDRGEAVADDDELPPPAVDTSDPEAAADNDKITEASVLNRLSTTH